MQQLMSVLRSAMERYNMVEDGDKIAVGVSGGKDSVALLVALANMRRFYPKQYDVVGITVDPQFQNMPGEYGKMQELCDTLGIEYIVKRTELYHVIFESRQEKNPCSLCARMRRGILHDAAKAAGCNKLALGHHLDDAAQTFLMNLFNGGTIGCFSPVSYLSRKDLTMIRPMILAKESEIIKTVNKEGLPIVKSKCPADGVTEREHMKTLLKNLEQDYDGLRDKLIGAMQRQGVSGW